MDASGTIYVANYNNNSLTIYAKGAKGNVAPIRAISGTSTGLLYPTEVTLDASGTIYVSNRDANTVTVFAAGAKGNVAPIRTIGGTNTGLNSPAGLALH